MANGSVSTSDEIGSGRVLPAFADVLRFFDDDDGGFERLADPVYGLMPDLTLAYFNRAWFDLAAGRPGWDASRWGLGRPVLDAIRGPLRDFYETAFRRVSMQGTPWEHRYQCPTPELFRTYWMRVLPVGAGRLLVVHAFERSEAALAETSTPLAEYVDDLARLLMCGHCRRARHGRNGDRWDFVPALIASPPVNVSHGLCPPCLGYHYPAA